MSKYLLKACGSKKLFETQMVCVPLCMDLHWSVVVLYNLRSVHLVANSHAPTLVVEQAGKVQAPM
jgi:hypothetical protein